MNHLNYQVFDFDDICLEMCPKFVEYYNKVNEILDQLKPNTKNFVFCGKTYFWETQKYDYLASMNIEWIQPKFNCSNEFITWWKYMIQYNGISNLYHVFDDIDGKLYMTGFDVELSYDSCGFVKYVLKYPFKDEHKFICKCLNYNVCHCNNYFQRQHICGEMSNHTVQNELRRLYSLKQNAEEHDKLNNRLWLLEQCHENTVEYKTLRRDFPGHPSTHASSTPASSTHASSTPASSTHASSTQPVQQVNKPVVNTPATVLQQQQIAIVKLLQQFCQLLQQKSEIINKFIESVQEPLDNLRKELEKLTHN